MSHRRVAVVLSVIALVSLSAVPAMSQSGRSASAQWAPPRPADGQPDLQGVWANNSATPLQRPAALAGKKVISDEELAELNQRIAEIRESEQAGDILGDRLIRQALDKDTPRTFDPITGNYNSFWLVERELDNRTSLVVDPPDGRIPSLTPAAQRSADAQRAYRREHPADGPEDRRLGDRCLHFGLPKIGSGYNSYHQILQTPDHVTIFSEMAHDARIIPLDTRPNLSHNLRQWNGDARGRWEGDTLVVETTNFSPKSNFRGSRENLRLVERFTRISPDTLEHEITIEDDTTWTSPWTVRLLLKESEDPIFEYACHEGNYAMMGILAAARAEERDAATGSR